MGINDILSNKFIVNFHKTILDYAWLAQHSGYTAVCWLVSGAGESLETCLESHTLRSVWFARLMAAFHPVRNSSQESFCWMLPALFSGAAPNFPSLERWRWYITVGGRGDILSWQGTFGPGGHVVLPQCNRYKFYIQTKWHIAARVSVGLPENRRLVWVLSLKTISGEYYTQWFMLIFRVCNSFSRYHAIVVEKKSQKIDDLPVLVTCRSGTLVMLSSEVNCLVSHGSTR